MRHKISLLAGLLLLLSSPCMAAAGPGGEKRPPASVEAAKVRVMPVDRTIEAVGDLISNESVVVSPEISGRVSEILFDEGADVEKGTALIRLDDSVFKAQLAQAEAQLALSEANYKRSDELYRKQSGTERARDEALASLNSNKAAVDLAKAQLAKTVIAAPFNGIAGLRQVSVGDYVTPGQSMFNFESIDPLKVDFRIAETYLSSAKVGQKINLNVDAFPDNTFEGHVYAIDPRIDNAGRSIVLRAELPNTDKILRPGLFARVKLIVERRENAIVIEEQALVPQGNQQFVYKVVDGKAVKAVVKTGQRRNGNVEIIDGLTPDDVVVTAGQMKIRDQAPVSILPPVTEPSGGAQE